MRCLQETRKVHQINKLVRETYAQRFQSVGMKPVGTQVDTGIAFACWTDAAAGNRPKRESTGGYLIGMVRKDFLHGSRGIVGVLRAHPLGRDPSS